MLPVKADLALSLVCLDSYKMDFSSCKIMPGFSKSSYSIDHPSDEGDDAQCTTRSHLQHGQQLLICHARSTTIVHVALHHSLTLPIQPGVGQDHLQLGLC